MVCAASTPKANPAPSADTTAKRSDLQKWGPCRSDRSLHLRAVFQFHGHCLVHLRREAQFLGAEC